MTLPLLLETWLSKTVDSTAIQIDGCTLYRNDRSGRRGGGIAVYVKERYNSSILSTANSHSRKLLGHELMWLKAFLRMLRSTYLDSYTIQSNQFMIRIILQLNFLMILMSLVKLVAYSRKLYFTSLVILTYATWNWLMDTLSTAAYIDRLLMQVNPLNPDLPSHSAL